MDKQSLIEQLLQPEIDYSKIKIGENYFYDEEWRVSGQSGRVNFSAWNELPLFKEQMRMYLLYGYKDNAFKTVVTKTDGITFFFRFVKDKYPYFKRIEDLNTIILNDYLDYTITYKKLPGNVEYNENGEFLSVTSLGRRTAFISFYLEMAEKKKWFKTDAELLRYYKKQMERKILKNPRYLKAVKKPTTKKEYKIETIKKIIQCAYEDEDLYLRAAVFIQTQCGLRIEEVLSIEEDGILGAPGKYRLRYETTKTRKAIVDKPINDVTAEIVKELIKFTEWPRKELNNKKIFVARRRNGFTKYYPQFLARNPEELNKWPTNTSCFIKKGNFNRDFIRPFLKRWDIREDGEPIILTTHYYRHFFACLAYLNEMSVQGIREFLNHASYKMTETYMYNAERAMREKFKVMIADPENMIGENIGDYKTKLNQKNVFKGRTEKQLETIIGVMNIKILSNGACMHHPLKAGSKLSQCEPNCLKCENFVTHKCYVDVHKKRVERLNLIMDDALEKSRKQWYERNKAERDYIIENFINPFDNMSEEADVF